MEPDAYRDLRVQQLSIMWCSPSLDNLHGWKIELSPPSAASSNFLIFLKDLGVKVINSRTILIHNQLRTIYHGPLNK